MKLNFFVFVLLWGISIIVPAQTFTLENAFPNLTFSSPVFLISPPDSTNRIFVVQQNGLIKVFPNSSNADLAKTFLNISDRVVTGSEMGLLGLAFHPEYKNNGYFYVNYTTTTPYRRTVVSRFQVTSNPDSADKDSELKIIDYYQPYTNHNGGWIGFRDTDGYLYINAGDGGSGGDPGNRAQNIDSLLGKILRIDIDNPDSTNNYGIPPDNPFVDSTGGVRKEIYAWGFRNPWRASFDPVDDKFWVADVGQNQWEEIDLVEIGKNYGWRCYEGTHPYNTSGCNYPEYIFPIWEYSHGPECSVTGGYVYRGPDVPELEGKYIYGDYCSAKIWSLEYDGITPPVNTYLLTAPSSVLSFGVDDDNELYITCANGRIYKFVPTVTSVSGEENPAQYFLEQNYPNPFNPSTTIKYQLAGNGFVSLKIFNSLGELIAEPVNKFQKSGIYQVEFDGSDLPSGMYVYQLRSGNFAENKKMMLLK